MNVHFISKLRTSWYKYKSVGSDEQKQPCTCKRWDLNVGGDQITLNDVIHQAATNEQKYLDIRNPELDSDAYPLTYGGCDRMPLLLPNEIIIQKFERKKTMHRLSLWKIQSAKLRCKSCSQSQNTILKLVVASLLVNDNFSTLLRNESDHTDLMLCESNSNELTRKRHLGTVYVTSERLIFVPLKDDSEGFSLPFDKITELKLLQEKSTGSSTKCRWFLLCYCGLFMTSVSFHNQSHAEYLLKLCTTVRFERAMSHFLPPIYFKNNVDNDIDWNQEETRLPTYSESEQALAMLLEQRGVIRSPHGNKDLSNRNSGENSQNNSGDNILEVREGVTNIPSAAAIAALARTYLTTEMAEAVYHDGNNAIDDPRLQRHVQRLLRKQEMDVIFAKIFLAVRNDSTRIYDESAFSSSSGRLSIN